MKRVLSEPLIEVVPEVSKYLDYSKIDFDVSKVPSRSSKKIPLKCPYCENRFLKQAHSITVYGLFCRKCRSLGTNYPELEKEWDYEQNEFTPFDVFPGSSKKVWWICGKCGNKWETNPYHRAIRKNGCPYCSGRVLSSIKKSLAYLYPQLAFEWNYSKNGDKVPWETTRSSGFNAWWICSVCGEEWKATVDRRTRGHGCPFCAGQRATEENNITKTHPELLIEYSNKNKIDPKTLMIQSNRKVLWECAKCGYEWNGYVYNRTKGHGCPNCAGQRVNDTNNLLLLFPEIAADWNYDRNKKGPEEYTSKTKKKVWWKCSKCNYEWETILSERTRSDKVGGGCPGCYNNAVSTISQIWLDVEGVPQVFGVNREVVIQCGSDTFKVDGFIPETNTIYEFLGDFWHGNPEIYQPKNKNPVNNETFGELHNKTMIKLGKLEKAGYNVVYIWEKDFLAAKNNLPQK